MADFDHDIYKNILFEAAYAGTERAALTKLRRFDQDGASSNGYLSPQQSISKGMQIAATVMPTDTYAAIALIDINPAHIDLA